MSGSLRSNTDALFKKQAPSFLAQTLRLLGASSLADLGPISDEAPRPLEPIAISDFRSVSLKEREAIAKDFYGRHGVASFKVMNPNARPRSLHPMIDLAQQLSPQLPLSYPISHPAEDDPSAIAMFGGPDGTLKVFQRIDQSTSSQNAELHLHQDGLGMAGAVVAIGLYCESAPVSGGFTCFQNGLRLALELARQDAEAFQALFLPSALTVTKKRGRHALRVMGPALYLNAQSEPQVLLRADGGDYDMSWSTQESLARARVFLKNYLKPFAPGSSFLSFSSHGQGCFVHNRFVLHGRTKYIESQSRKRVLSRKWFAASAEQNQVRHVPGLRVLDEYAQLRPDLFGDEVLCGEWFYDDAVGTNVLLNHEH